MHPSRVLRSVPFSLTILRLALAPAVLGIACGSQWKWAFVACLVAGFLSDIFDGILARRIGVATPALRRFDSATDLVFYAALIWAAWIVHPDAIRANVAGLGILLVLELTCN